MKKMIQWVKSIDMAMLFTRFLTGAFGLTWLLLIFKVFRIGYMKNISAYAILFPMLFYIIASISYLVLKMSLRKWFDEPRQPVISEEQLRYMKRMGHLYKKPTRIKTAMKRAFLALLSILITYYLLNLFR